MMNEPPSDQDRKPRRPHPLEAPPTSDASDQQGGPRPQRVMLHMPVVKPYAVWVLIGFNALIYIVVQFLIADSLQQQEVYQWAWNNHTAVLQFGEYHRLLTSMFLHSLDSPFHIVFNMFALYAIGITVERFFGHTRFLVVYFLGGLTGSIFSVLLSPADVVSVGASGAVFAIFGAEMVFLYNHRKLFGEMARTQFRQLVVIALLNFAFGIFSTLSASGTAIDNWAHIGGFIGGGVITWFIGPILIPRRHPTQPGALTIEDINPLNQRYQPLLAYVSVMLLLLLAGTVLARSL
ncbi:MAG: rhomboid family intramembrane serine protease [Phototrophicaceae bacterium]